MANNKRIAQNTLFLYFRMFLVMGMNLYASRIILKALGIEDFGLYNVVGGIVTMFSFINGALSAATSRYLTFELGKNDIKLLNKIFNTALLSHCFIGIIIVFLAETIGLWFFYQKMIIPEDRLYAAMWVYQISILTSVFSITQVPYTATIIAHENMKIYAYVSIVEVSLKLIVVFIIANLSYDRLISYALLLCLVQIILMLYYRNYCSKHYKECTIKLNRDKQLYKEMFSYGSFDMIGNLSVLAQGQGLNILLNLFFGPTVNAARGIAYQLQGAITQFSNNFMTAVKPQIIKSYAIGDIKGMIKLMEGSSLLSFYLMLIIALPLWFESDFVLKLWLGEYPLHTTTFLKLTIILCLIQSLKTPRTAVFHATGKIKLTNIIIGSILCSALPIAYCLLKLGFPPESVFWAANITMIISELVSTFILKKYVQFSAKKYFINVHARCSLVTIITGLILYLIFDKFIEQSFTRLIITCINSTIITIIVCFMIGLDKQTKTIIIQIIKQKILKK